MSVIQASSRQSKHPARRYRFGFQPILQVGTYAPLLARYRWPGHRPGEELRDATPGPLGAGILNTESAKDGATAGSASNFWRPNYSPDRAGHNAAH
jgi:hypothetical protein